MVWLLLPQQLPAKLEFLLQQNLKNPLSSGSLIQPLLFYGIHLLPLDLQSYLHTSDDNVCLYQLNHDICQAVEAEIS
uniref:Uncharacterized protein n=1 Tax=Lotus japonicus TaxID=34305 RepID=I3SYJ6_LOTJA|nr:unknown [Lotus japonicus]